MNRYERLGILLLLQCTLLTVGSAHANLIVNGGFESIVSDPGAFGGLAPSDWTLSQGGADSFTFDNCGNVPTAAPPHSGSCAMTFATQGTDGSISQTLATVAGSQYAISFWLGNFLTLGGGTDNSFSVTFGGIPIFSETDIPLEPYTLLTEFATATSATTVLSFAGRNFPDSTGLDDVSVELAVIPEPASIALVATALLGFGAIRRKRR